MASIILIRGGGDLATGIAIRLIRSRIQVVITELPAPLAVRRTVSFGEAVYAGEITVEGITARKVHDPLDTLKILTILGKGQVPVLVDPDSISAKHLHPCVIVDARMTKKAITPINYIPQLYIGLGPGFYAGVNCQAVIETRRSHTLGRVIWQGSPQEDTGIPEGDPSRVLRAPVAGKLIAHAQIGDLVSKGQPLAEIDTSEITQDADDSAGSYSGNLVQSPFEGVLRGLLHPGLVVEKGQKIGDVDPRGDPSFCNLVSDKSLSIGGGVLEAILSKQELRTMLWT